MQGMEIGKKEGLKKGEYKKAIETTKRLHQMGLI